MKKIILSVVISAASIPSFAWKVPKEGWLPNENKVGIIVKCGNYELQNVKSIVVPNSSGTLHLVNFTDGESVALDLGSCTIESAAQ
jgi:hypothetical protein